MIFQGIMLMNELKSFGMEFLMCYSLVEKKRYKLLSVIVKSAVILGQTNAESECSLSVNARVVTQDRSLLNEETFIGLRVVKEAVQFHDPVSHQPEKIIIREELKRYVRSVYTSHQESLEREQEGKREKKKKLKKEKQFLRKCRRKEIDF